MELFYDERDDPAHEARQSHILYWLDDLGAKPVSEARPDAEGFVFAGARPIEDYARLVARLPLLRDRPEARKPLMHLDTVLETLNTAGVHIATPRTWYLAVDTALPTDLTFPLFVRTAASSWKLGGRISKVDSLAELESESAELRRAMGWDALILARVWHKLAEAGRAVYGPVPKEIRVWIVDQIPFAWTFHYMNVVSMPRGFPPDDEDLKVVTDMARKIGSVFRSRLVAADFAKEENGQWLFIEAGPGSCAGTGHEAVFKAVASRLRGAEFSCAADALGGLLAT